MGHPIRSNLFIPGSPERAEFRRYRVQVAVLFSPSDTAFSSAFREAFLHLHRLTGEHLAFFAVLDPPQDWLREAGDRPWWRRYSADFGPVGFSYDDRVLVQEIAGHLGVSWDALPALVVANDLWLGRRLAIGTSPWDFERQFLELTRLADEWRPPPLELMAEELSAATGREAVLLPPPSDRVRLARFYEFLETAHGPHVDLHRYRRLLEQELRQVDRLLAPSRRLEGPSEELPPALEGERSESAVREAASRLVAPATVAARMREGLLDCGAAVVEGLDEFSQVNLENSYRVGHFLETQRHEPREPALRDRGGSHPCLEDFRPGAQGAWTAFEREMNLSLVQAARASRSVRMPDLWTLYDHLLPVERAKVSIQPRAGEPFDVHLNLKGPLYRNDRRHRFLTLGQARALTEAMLRDPRETFDRVIQSGLGGPLPEAVLKAASRIHEVRNRGSHAEQPVTFSDYRRVLENVCAPEVIGPLIRLKRALASRDAS